LIVAVFALVGVAFGVVGFVASDWARTQFVAGATGSQPETFGPVFLALSIFQITVTLFLAGPVLAVVLGLLSGSRFADVSVAAGVAGGVPVFCLPGSENAARLGSEEIIVEEAGHLAGLARRE